MMRKLIPFLMLANLAAGCGWIRGLRREALVEDPHEMKKARYEVNELQVKPVTVLDSRSDSVAGTPVDLSGERAKQGRVTARNFFSENYKNENSLWAEEGQSNFFFAQNNLKLKGELVTVLIEEQLQKAMENKVRQFLPEEYQSQDIVVPGLTDHKVAAATNAPASPGSSAQSPAVAGAANSNGGGVHPNELMTAEVLERYANGNIRIRGMKDIPLKSGVKHLEVLAIVRSKDIDEKDQVKSGKFFEQRVELYQ